MNDERRHANIHARGYRHGETDEALNTEHLLDREGKPTLVALFKHHEVIPVVRAALANDELMRGVREALAAEARGEGVPWSELRRKSR